MYNSEIGAKPWNKFGPYNTGNTYQSFSFTTLYDEYFIGVDPEAGSYSANFYSFGIIPKGMITDVYTGTSGLSYRGATIVNGSTNVCITAKLDIKNNRIQVTCMVGSSAVTNYHWYLFYR